MATARLLASLGAKVVIGGRDEAKLERAAASGSISTLAFDATDPSSRAEALAKAGAIDHLVLALSGGKGGGPFPTLRSADLRGAFDAKFWAHYSLAQEALGYLRKDGSVTFVSAISARIAGPGTAGLSAVNAAIEALVKPLAMELRPLRVNAVAPGIVDTPWWDSYDPETKKAIFDGFAARTPAGRNGRPEDIATAIVFLMGNTFMTGAVIECDGGLRLAGSLG